MKRTKKVSAKKVKKIAQEDLKQVGGGSQTQTSCTTYENGSRVCTGVLGPVDTHKPR